MAGLIRAFDWARTPLGPLARWPQSLKTITGFLLQSPVPMVLLWGPDGVMIYNDAYSVFAGGRHPKILGSNVREGWPEVADFNDNVMKVGLAGGTLAYKDMELTLHRTGRPEQVWMNLDYSPVLDESGTPAGVIAIVVETTERVLADRRIAAEQERQRQLFEQMPGFVAVLAGPEHVYEYVNEAYVKISGRRDIVGQTVREAFPELAGQGFYELLDRAYRTGEAVVMRAMELRLHGSDDIQFIDFVYQPIRDEKGDVSGIFVGGYEVTDTHRAAAALRASEQQFRTLAQALPNHVWTARPDGMLDWFNDQVYAYSGAAPGELDGDKWTKIVHPEDVPVAAERWAHTLASGKAYDTEFRLRGADGTYRWHLARAIALRNPEGEIARWIGTNTDIHDQKAAAAALADLNATLEARVQERTGELMVAEQALRQSQKMEAVGQLTGGIAHDFNNMLAIIMGSLDLATRRLERGDSGVQNYLANAREGAARAASLTQRLLSFSRQSPLAPKVTDINALVGAMSELLRRTLGERIVLETVQAGGLWMTNVDPNQLESAIINLAVNARDAMPDGGKLTIEIANVHLDERYAAREIGVTAGQYVMVSVTDVGLGMPADVVERAFDPFFTTKAVGKGTGLGLSMVYGFAKQSGGHVRLYSEPGRGTSAKIYLPRHFGSVEEATAALAPPSMSRATEAETILVVEDEVSVRRMSIEALRELGYTVHAASDGEEALQLFDSLGKIDLLFTDIVMPGMTGRQLADALRAKVPDLKVLYTTGYTRNAVVHNGVLDAGVAFLPKPFSVADLAAKLRATLDS